MNRDRPPVKVKIIGPGVDKDISLPRGRNIKRGRVRDLRNDPLRETPEIREVSSFADLVSVTGDRRLVIEKVSCGVVVLGSGNGAQVTFGEGKEVTVWGDPDGGVMVRVVNPGRPGPGVGKGARGWLSRFWGGVRGRRG